MFAGISTCVQLGNTCIAHNYGVVAIPKRLVRFKKNVQSDEHIYVYHSWDVVLISDQRRKSWNLHVWYCMAADAWDHAVVRFSLNQTEATLYKLTSLRQTNMCFAWSNYTHIIRDRCTCTTICSKTFYWPCIRCTYSSFSPTYIYRKTSR